MGASSDVEFFPVSFMNESIKKVLRFTKIYGLPRTLTKICGRIRIGTFFFSLRPVEKSAGMLGCGQFAFSTLAYFALKKGVGFISCFDVEETRASSFSNFYRVEQVATSANDLLDIKELKTVFIASNHASHTGYALKALKLGVNVHIEKPVSVNYEEFGELLRVKRLSSAKIVAGYNRPFSKAIRFLGKKIGGNMQPISLSCFVSGHVLGEDHWYRKPQEGTRICGNVGHWIDLAMHLFNVRGELPDTCDVCVTYANVEDEPDDNISISISTNLNDLVNIFLTARSEPFEGINETINVQSGNMIAKIDDFRSMQYWNGSIYKKLKFWPKDVGHKKSVEQVLGGRSQRDWHEVELSTVLMLGIKEMVLAREVQKSFEIKEELQALIND
ncbi:Gfo/Idh/MocA family oxidoreductase [Akkermansiaceae bacterium]|nr:Gfo/Idh/MocA family oxidoreductase [Akkermansiaceae bacterium]